MLTRFGLKPHAEKYELLTKKHTKLKQERSTCNPLLLAACLSSLSVIVAAS